MTHHETTRPERAMTPTHTTDWSKPGDYYGYTQYRIELCHTDHGWYQRHIWRDGLGNVFEEQWIPTFDMSRPNWLDTFHPVADGSGSSGAGLRM